MTSFMEFMLYPLRNSRLTKHTKKILTTRLMHTAFTSILSRDYQSKSCLLYFLLPKVHDHEILWQLNTILTHSNKGEFKKSGSCYEAEDRAADPPAPPTHFRRPYIYHAIL